MDTVILLSKTRTFLDETLPGDEDPDAKIRRLIEAECLRRLGRYRRADMALTSKYNMSFDEFIARRIAQQKDYSWEVEQDAMDWETAIGGMATVDRQLRELREFNGG